MEAGSLQAGENEVVDWVARPVAVPHGRHRMRSGQGIWPPDLDRIDLSALVDPLLDPRDLILRQRALV